MRTENDPSEASREKTGRSLSAKGQRSTSSNSRSYECVSVRPDGGLAWIVVLASFIINLVVDGFLYSFGAISEDLRIHYRCQEWSVSLVISLACGFYLLTAPVASALCNKYGCGLVGVAGSILASVAVAASVYSPNIYVMWLLFGLFGGIGMGLVYLPSIVMVGYCFKDKRAIATGIVTAGTGIGSITFGPLSMFLFNKLGWQTGLQTLAAILLVCAYCCLLMVPIKTIGKESQMPLSDGDTPDSVDQTVNVPLLTEANSTGFGDLASAAEIQESPSSLSGDKSAVTEHNPAPVKAFKSVDRSIEKLNVVADVPDDTTVSKKKTSPSSGGCCNVFRSMATFNDPTERRNMIIICLGNICSMAGYFTPYLFIVKMATSERSIDKNQAVYLLSIIGFSNTAARFASGWIAKLPFMTPLRVNNIGLAIAGLSTLMVPLCTTHTHLIIYCIVWGAFIAFHVSLSPVIVCEIVGLDKFSSALGLTLMFRGITSLAAPPLMGAIRDVTQSFNIPFIIGGLSFIISAILHLFVTIPNSNEDSPQETEASKTVLGKNTRGNEPSALVV